MRFLGVDIGTGSSKGVLTDEVGNALRQARRDHATSTPQPGWFEHDADRVWFSDLALLSRELLRDEREPVTAVCVSGIGPALLLTDRQDRPLRPAILYGIDTRATSQVDDQNSRIGRLALERRAGNPLSSQSIGPKLQWVAENEPLIWAEASRLYSAPSWLVRRLTGQYVLDRYSASASDPLYDITTSGWWEEQWAPYPTLERPRLVWPSEIVGTVTKEAAALTGIPAGTPAVAGTIDALAEAYSVGCRSTGDTMVMYGSTMFMIQVTDSVIGSSHLWAMEGRIPGTYTLAAGMSTGGLVTTWLKETLGQDYSELAAAAARVAPGSEGLLLLPYFAGERTPIFDPLARGAWIGLNLRHGPAHLYRSALEGIALGVRHNLDSMTATGAAAARLIAVGGGTAQRIWPQIVSDVTGLAQDLPSLTIGAAYGDARLAADAVGHDTAGWNPIAERLDPNPASAESYSHLYKLYLSAYPLLAETMHALANK